MYIIKIYIQNYFKKKMFHKNKSNQRVYNNREKWLSLIDKTENKLKSNKK